MQRPVLLKKRFFPYIPGLCFYRQLTFALRQLEKLTFLHISLRLLQTFASVCQKKIRLCAVFKETLQTTCQKIKVIKCRIEKNRFVLNFAFQRWQRPSTPNSMQQHVLPE